VAAQNTCDAWRFAIPAVQSRDEYIKWSVQEVQLDGRAKCASPSSQSIVLRACPRTPFDDDDQTPCKELLGQSSLQSLNPGACFLAASNLKCIQPFIGAETDRAHSGSEFTGVSGLSRTR